MGRRPLRRSPDCFDAVEFNFMNGKHTPGPWSVDTRYGPCNVSAPAGRSICSTGGYSDNFSDPEKRTAENEANARLIAAAPDLLEAWQEYFAAVETLAELESNRDTTKHFDDAFYAKERAENKARAALAKAVGQ
jgi:hypothetical protein